jgi:hypothetical protein
MLVRDAFLVKPGPVDADVRRLTDSVSEADLRGWVKWFSVPRHFVAHPKINREMAETIAGLFRDWGYEVSLQGEFYNVVAQPAGITGPRQLVGAHFDSTAFTPGADDNASAIAAMLGCAKALTRERRRKPVMFVAFNREEDGLLGSADYVERLSASQQAEIVCAHILEMVGFASDRLNSQKIPAGLPVRIPRIGNFLGLLANDRSAGRMKDVLECAATYLPDFPTLGLRTLLGFERYFPVLLRSDHAPFWRRDIPSVMWTDTSEFRNPNYHRDTDLPETLDYTFLRRVTQLLIATVTRAVPRYEKADGH